MTGFCSMPLTMGKSSSSGSSSTFMLKRALLAAPFLVFGAALAAAALGFLVTNSASESSSLPAPALRFLPALAPIPSFADVRRPLFLTFFARFASSSS